MRAVVLGGGGLTGRCAVRDLAERTRFEEIVVADLDLAVAQAAAHAAGPKARPVAIDVRDPAQVEATLRGAAVCINAVQYTFNLEVMGGCLNAGVPYLDFGGLFHMTRRQLEWDDRFRSAGLLAIPGLGQVPGASNVLAAAATEDLDQVDSIVLRDGWRDLTRGGPELIFTWSPSTFLDEMELPAQVWHQGRYEPAPAMSGAEPYDFAAPVGRTTVYRTLHSEPATLPESLRDKSVGHCEWKEGGPGIELLRALSLMGLGGTEPVLVRGQPVVPRELLIALLRERKLLGFPPGVTADDWEVLDIEIRGHRAGRSVERHAVARFPPWPDWQLSATEYAVGVCGAIGADLIAQGRVRGRGVIPPERCVPADAFRSELHRRGIATAICPPEPPLAAEYRDRPTG